MSDFNIDLRGLDKFKKELDDLQRHFPKQARQLMMRSGSKARTIVARKARQLVRKQTGNYHKSIKRGKVWIDDSSGEVKVRVYTRAPHGHLIELGHRIVGKDGSEHGFKQGYHVFDKATKEIEDAWTTILEKEFDRIMSKL
ncbi:HK97 gp10 family phage protein [Paenibacillus validus]|uniref:HK97 gp10 family phage protein n=1 Tax=Paenibacillus validus TaxID=44253 RepID=UPI000FDAFCFD|nr:HK97 gp10 family phage protein [Paenibacillus validus]MED4599872.1 HK97 gp10 family phage protein [Paenibacillus validus]MED4606095.1 HK97 gp10 family phage protein [Paenibacillus validus]